MDENQYNNSATVSAFGGTPLTAIVPVMMVTGDDTEQENPVLLTALAQLGIADAEQLVAVAAVPDAVPNLAAALGVKEAEVATVVAQAAQLLTPERFAQVSVPAPRDLAFGALLPPPDEAKVTVSGDNDIPVSVGDALPFGLPNSVNLISYLNPIRNQAARGTCVSFALTALNEYVQRRRGRIVNLSEQFLYFQIKMMDGSPMSCGTFQAKAVIPLAQLGQCLETDWPYNPNAPCNNHGMLPLPAMNTAQQFRLQTVAVPYRDVAAYKAALAREQLVTCSIAVYNSWYESQETRRSGRITMRLQNEAPAGGHAICLVGYQDDANSPGGGYFIVRNSWNGYWGTQSPYGVGYGVLPYQYVINDAWEAYTATIPTQFTTGDEEMAKPASEPTTVVVTVGDVRVTISR